MSDCVTHPSVPAQAVCAGCLRPYCSACLAELLGAPYCGWCRNARLAALQGHGPVDAPFAGTGKVDPGRWLMAGWEAVQANLLTYGLAMLITLLITSATGAILAAVLACGMYLMSFRSLRGGQPVDLAHLFDGFRRFWHAFLGTLLYVVAAVALSIAILISMLAVGVALQDSTGAAYVFVIGLYGLAIVGGILLNGITFFALPHIAARNANPIDALSASWSVFRLNPVGITLTALLLRIVAAAGLLLCGVGYLVTGPLSEAATAKAYADHFGLAADLP